VLPVLIPSIGVVLVAVIGLLGQLATSRNERSFTNQEVDLLQKLDPKSKVAKDLSEVIEARVSGWHRRFYKPSGQPEVPDQPQRSAGDATLVLHCAGRGCDCDLRRVGGLVALTIRLNAPTGGLIFGRRNGLRFERRRHRAHQLPRRARDTAPLSLTWVSFGSRP
jgi:hypothetical protein